MVDDASCVDMILEVDDDDEGMTKAEAPVDARSSREVAAVLAIFMMIKNWWVLLCCCCARMTKSHRKPQKNGQRDDGDVYRRTEKNVRM